jgi:hypothetical protein
MHKEVVDFLLICSKFYPTCFGIWLSSSGVSECLVPWAIVGFFYKRYYKILGSTLRIILPQQAKLLKIYTPNISYSRPTQLYDLRNTTLVAYKVLTTPWGWQPYAETCRGRVWNVLIIKKSITACNICWSFYKPSHFILDGKNLIQ